MRKFFKDGVVFTCILILIESLKLLFPDSAIAKFIAVLIGAIGLIIYIYFAETNTFRD